MSQIYKINYIVNNKIKKIFVFVGNLKVEERSTGFKLKDGSDIFSIPEWNRITSENIQVIILQKYIHGDDYVIRVKEKILMECRGLNSSTAEMYLFTIQKEKIDIASMYYKLTQNDTIDLNNNRLMSFLYNFVSNSHTLASRKRFFQQNKNVKKDKYDFDDLNEITLDWNSKLYLTKAIGQNIVVKSNYPFVGNPYNNKAEDTFLAQEGENVISTQNNYSLFKYFPIENNNIYLCLATDVVGYADVNELDSSYFLKLYFPILFNEHNIKTSQELMSKKLRIYDSTKNSIKKFYKAYNERIDIFYDIFNENKHELNYESVGIKSLHITIHPNNNIKLPLEILFKIIHSNETIPLIKYNPGEKYENIYRLFTKDYVSTDGLKIPSILVTTGRKGKIINLTKILASRNSVGFLIYYTYNNEKIEIFCEFFENGNISIKFESNLLLEQHELDRIIKESVDDYLLEIIRKYLKQSGYEYIHFKSISDKNIEINNIDYQFRLENKKKLDLGKLIGCLSAIFNIIDKKSLKTTDVINLIYKRVSSFRIMDSIKSFITVKRQNGITGKQLLDELVENFPKEVPTVEKAQQELVEWSQEVEMKVDSFGNKSRIVDTTPGFKTTITTEVFSEKTITVFTVHDINDIRYLRFMNIYVDSMFKLLMKIRLNETLKAKANKICEKVSKKITKAENIEDIKKPTVSGKLVFADAIDEGEFDEETDLEEDDFFDDDDEDDDDEDDDDEDDDDEDDDTDDDDSEDKENGKSKETKEIPDEPSIILPVKKKTPTPVEKTPTPVEKTPTPVEKTPTPVESLSPIDDSIEVDDDSIPVGDDSIAASDNSIAVGDDDDSIEIGDDDDSIEIGDDDDAISLGDASDLESLPDDSPDSIQQGGAKGDNSDDEEIDIDLTNLSLSGAKNIFMKRMRDRDPELFEKKETPGYKSYSRTCPSQYKRQPIILTDQEKDYIDARDRESGVSSYDESIRYGSGDKKYNYICPRFWCIRDDKGKGRSLTVKQINDGECGGWDALITNPKAKKVPKGKRIVEFTDKRFHLDGVSETEHKSWSEAQKKLIYRPMYPGFQDPSKHPKNLCVPCCYLDPSTKGTTIKMGSDIPGTYENKNPKPTFEKDASGKIIMESIKGVSRKRPGPKGALESSLNQCNQSIDGLKVERKIEDKKLDDVPGTIFPLKVGQLGYMNIYLQKFLGFDNASICYKYNSALNSDKRLKPQQYCLVRMGVEKNKNQSFLCLLSSVYKYYDKTVRPEKLKPAPESLSEFKNYFISNLTLEKFAIAQNGILPKVFSTDKKVSMRKYKNIPYLLKLNDPVFKKNIVSAYENFINYFMSDEIIDYTYIWDLVTRPMEKGGVLFREGINLLIMNSPDDDITSKINVICPTNHYSNNFFDTEKKTLMMYLKSGYFEPLIKIKRETRTTFKIFRFLDLRDLQSFSKNSDIVPLVLKIKDLMIESCMAKKSLGKRSYDFERNILLPDMLQEIEKLNYTFISQIVNFNNQVIGIIVSRQTKKFYLPILPSSVLLDKEYKFIQNINTYKSYEQTKMFLESTFVESNENIPCKPIKKIVDDGMIVGIITKTNQFVPVLPEKYIDDGEQQDLPTEIVSKISNYLTNDQSLLQNKKIDRERQIVVKKIELENNFYNLFRNTLKIVINYAKHKNIKNEILNIINNVSISYIDKLTNIQKKLFDLLKPVIQFRRIELDTLDEYDDLVTCLQLNNTDCSKQQGCFLRRENGICQIILPKNNLFSGKKNKEVYFMKITDEIIRYQKIQKYIFTPRTFLSFEHVNYQINDDEIILLEEIFLEQYLDNIELMKHNAFIKTINLYSLSNPERAIKNIPYSSSYDLTKTDFDEVKAEEICLEPNTKLLKTTNTFKSLFNLDLIDTKMVTVNQYKDMPMCAFSMIQTILNDHLSEEITIDQIKTVLGDMYIGLEMPNNNLKLKADVDANSVSVFSLFHHFSFKKEIAESVYNLFLDKRPGEIKKQILMDTYFPSEFDLLLIFNHFDVPVLLRMNALQKMYPSYFYRAYNTRKNENYYVIVANREKSKNNTYCLLRYSDVYKIDDDIINKQKLYTTYSKEKVSLTETYINVNDYVENNIRVLEHAKELARQRDLKRKKIKKLGKKKLGKKK